MGYLSKRRFRFSATGTTVAGLLLLAGVFVTIGLLRTQQAAAETAVVEAVCRHLLDNTTAGRQALVCSAWWPPLPTLLRLPLVSVFGILACPMSSLVISALFGAGVLILLDRILAGWRLGWLRYLFLAALVLQPQFLIACTNGSSDTTVLYFALLTLYGLTDWVATRQLRYLVYLGLGSSLLVLADASMVAWVLIVFLLLIVDQFRARESPSQKEAAIILGVVPAFYTIGLWVLMNWLIMGDWLYFVRPLFQLRIDPTPQTVMGLTRFHCAVTAAMLLPLLAGALWRRRAGVYNAVAVASLAVLALLLRAHELLWPSSSILIVLFPAALLGIGLVTRLVRGLSPAAAVVPGMLPLALTVLMLSGHLPPAQPEHSTLADVQRERNLWRHRIRAHVLDRSQYGMVFCCGFDSFRLLGHESGDLFVHALDFNFNKAKDDYYGHRLFVLVPRPVGRSRLDSVHWKYPAIYTLGHRNALYDGDWGHWRLFEVIQAPRRTLR